MQYPVVVPVMMASLGLVVKVSKLYIHQTRKPKLPFLCSVVTCMQTCWMQFTDCVYVCNSRNNYSNWTIVNSFHFPL